MSKSGMVSCLTFTPAAFIAVSSLDLASLPTENIDDRKRTMGSTVWTMNGRKYQ